MRHVLSTLCLIPSLAIADCTEDAMIVFDASSSMSAPTALPDRPVRIVEAREAMRDALPQLAPYRNIGLMVYGPGVDDGCSHIRLEVSPSRNAAEAILDTIDDLTPDGSTALTDAVLQAAQVLATKSQRGTIVLVTDGEETCGGRTCAIAAGLAAEMPDITVHVVGFRMRQTYLSRDYSEFALGQGADPIGAECLAASTGGLYVTPGTVDELVDALYETLGCQVNS